MGWLKQATGLDTPEIAGRIVEGIGKAADGLFTSTEEAIKVKTELVESLQELDQKVLETVDREFSEVTARWESDSKGDAWLAKNVRPLTMGFVTLLLAGLTFADQSGYVLRDRWVDLWEMSYMTIIAAYFGSRGIEKAIQINQSANQRLKDGLEYVDPKRFGHGAKRSLWQRIAGK